jgi:hypothetical protein
MFGVYLFCVMMSNGQEQSTAVTLSGTFKELVPAAGLLGNLREMCRLWVTKELCNDGYR